MTTDEPTSDGDRTPSAIDFKTLLGAKSILENAEPAYDKEA
jgi:hypothetical protein